MLLRRKAYQELLNWKRIDNGTTALLIDGARRVGKSFLAEELGKNEYKSYITVDFSRANKTLFDVFENDTNDLDLFFNKLSVFFGKQLYVRDSLVIFDEVQRYPKARELIKFLVLDGRYDYIETGSLLSIKRNISEIVIPSEETHMNLYPLDFEEFLWAVGDNTTAAFLAKSFENKTPLGQAVHRKVMNSFRQYMLIGGMPQVVAEYATSRDFSKADRIKKNILTLYREDVKKFADGYENKVISIFDEIPAQLSKKEKRFTLAALEKNAKMRAYEDAFIWLSEAMITNVCFNTTDPTVGLLLNRDITTQKCYLADTGLLVTQTFMDDEYIDNELYKAILLDKLGINEGMLMENIVAQTLRAKGHKLFFYSRHDSASRENEIEIDFLVKIDKKICPIEVKSSGYSAHSSLDKFVTKFKGKVGQPYILYTKDLQVKDGIVHLPIYMAMFL
jgi:predicted AAA+ superfamily ATPase